MKSNTVLTALIVAFIPCLLQAQNALPNLKNIKATVGKAVSEIKITYDLSDPDNEKMEVSLALIGPHGEVINVSGATGDIGYPVLAGNKKTITWHYPESLNKKTIKQYKLRLVADDRQKTDIAALVKAIDTIPMKSALLKVSGMRGHDDPKELEQLEAVRNFIAGTFQQYGLPVQKQDTTFTATKETIAGLEKAAGLKSEKYKLNNSYHLQNIISEIKGTDEQAPEYIVCAHYDAVAGSPGADDNASGVAGLLELARVFSTYQFKSTIKFIGFDLEEKGLWGSAIFVNQGLAKKAEGVINYDMIGYYTDKPNTQIIPEGFDQLFPTEHSIVAKDNFRGNFVLNTTNAQSRPFAQLFTTHASSYVPDLKVIALAMPEGVGGLASSDHASFWVKGIKAIHIGDGASSRNTNYHRKGDKVETINFLYMGNIVKATAATLAEVAGIQHATAVVVSL